MDTARHRPGKRSGGTFAAVCVLALAAVLSSLAPGARAAPVPVSAREPPGFVVAVHRIRPEHFAEDACTIIEKEAAPRGMPAAFIARLIWVESRFAPAAVSPKGAQGIAQFMPGTARLRRLADPFEPISALTASIGYLAELRRRFGNLGLAAAAYNAGEARAESYVANGGSMPLETEDYVRRITGRSIAEWVGAADEAPKPLDAALPFVAACRRMVETRRAATLPAAPPPEPSASVPSAPRQPWGVQVYESFSVAQAVSVFRNHQKRLPDIFGDGPPMIVPVRNYSMGYRLRHAAFLGAPTRAEADRKCAAMRGRGVACIVLKP